MFTLARLQIAMYTKAGLVKHKYQLTTWTYRRVVTSMLWLTAKCILLDANCLLSTAAFGMPQSYSLLINFWLAVSRRLWNSVDLTFWQPLPSQSLGTSNLPICGSGPSDVVLILKS